MLTMEFVLHFIYVVAIKDAKAWAGDTPFQLSMIGAWNLIVMWLKVRSLLHLLSFTWTYCALLRSTEQLLIPWR